MNWLVTGGLKSCIFFIYFAPWVESVNNYLPEIWICFAPFLQALPSGNLAWLCKITMFAGKTYYFYGHFQSQTFSHYQRVKHNEITDKSH